MNPPNETETLDPLDPKVKEAVDAICDGGTLAEIRGLSEADMEVLYGIAYNFYTHGRYDEAEKVFIFLCTYDHLEKRFWKGLAASRQMGGKSAGAADAYGCMTICDLDDPEPHFQAARCLLAIGAKKRASSALDAAIELAERSSDPKHKALVEQAGQLKRAADGGKQTKAR